MLESLDQSNIKRMSVENQEAKQAPDFDKDKELADIDWDELAKRTIPSDTDWRSVFIAAEYAEAITLLNPEFARKLDLSDLTKNFEGVADGLQGNSGARSSRTQLASWAQLFYSLSPEFPISKYQDALREDIRFARKYEDWYAFAVSSSNMNKMGFGVDISDEDRQAILVHFNDIWNVFFEEGRYRYVNALSQLFKKKFVLDRKKYNKLYDNFLAAKESGSVDKTLEGAIVLDHLTKRKQIETIDLTQSTPDLPEQRNF